MSLLFPSVLPLPPLSAIPSHLSPLSPNAPANTPHPGVFVVADPLSPPAVLADGPQLIPDFNPAWATALARARALIAGFSTEEKVRRVFKR